MANATAKYTIKLEDRTKRAFKAIGRSLNSIRKSIFSMKTAFISAAGIAGIGFFVKKSMDATDEMAKMSRAIGVSVEELSALRHAASLGGLEATQLDKAVQKLAINMADMSRGVGLAKDVFEKHNISVANADGSLRTVMEVMDDVADVTAGMTNATEKADLAYKLFGARGAKMINMLNGGSEAMREAMKEAELLGLVMSSETAAGVEAANDSFTRLKSFVTSTFAQTVAALAPSIRAMTDAIIEFITLKVQNTDGGIAAIARSMANMFIDAAVMILRSLESISNGVIEFTRKIKVSLGFGTEIEKLEEQLISLKSAETDFGTDGFGNNGDGILKLKQNLDTAAKRFSADFWDTVTFSDKGTKFFTDRMAAEISNVEDQLRILREAGGQTGDKMKISFDSVVDSLLSGRQHIVMLGDSMEVLVTQAEESNNAIKESTKTVYEEMKEGFESYFNSVKNGSLSLASITEGALRSAEDAIVNMMMGVKTNWKSLFKAILADLIRLQLRKALVGAFGGFFANGGRPPVGRPSIVGEKGAELFVPDSAGTIIPNHELGGSSQHTTAEINFNVQAIDAASFNSYLVNNRDTIESVINNSLLTNGSVRRTIQMVG